MGGSDPDRWRTPLDTTTHPQRHDHDGGDAPAPIAQQQFDTTWAPDPHRYEAAGAVYRRCGRSGLDLPAISLGLWHNFGDDHPLSAQRDILRTAFDLGITEATVKAHMTVILRKLDVGNRTQAALAARALGIGIKH